MNSRRAIPEPELDAKDALLRKAAMGVRGEGVNLPELILVLIPNPWKIVSLPFAINSQAEQK